MAGDAPRLEVWLLDIAVPGPRGTENRAAVRAGARHALRAVCAACLGRPPDEVPLRHLCPSCGADDHGRPYLAGPDGLPHISLSHSGRRVAVALSDAPVGVDTERVRDDIDWSRMRALVLAPGEPEPGGREAWFNRWCLKEAVVKMTGDGLRLPMPLVRLEPGGPDGWLRARTPGASGWVRGLAAEDGWAAAVAVAAGAVPRTPRVHRRVAAAPGPFRNETTQQEVGR